ncbi:hypothetical protein BGX24_003614 [Mortierella sp. AD032]|nr:hypothetical protein BGX24_003614 [Mortierella sp. AD032]
MRSHGQHLPRPLLLAIFITLIATLSSSATALYWRTEFYPCKDRRDDIGVSVTMLYCDMYKFTKAGYKCSNVHCEAPESNCIKNIAKDPIEQAKAYLALTGACQGLNNARYEKVEYEFDYYSRPGVKTITTSALRHQRCLFAVQDKALDSTD